MQIRGCNIRVLKAPKLDDFRYLFDAVQERGANAVALNTIHYVCCETRPGAPITYPQARWYPHHSLVYPDVGQLPHMVGETVDIARVWAITEMALDRGLTVMLKPMVDVQWTHGWTGGWRGNVTLPASLYKAFYTHYAAFLRPYARLAHDYDCVLCIGTEMLQITRDHTCRFWYKQYRDLVDSGYAANCTYAANWGHVADEGAEYKLVEPMYSAPGTERLVWAGIDGYWNWPDLEGARAGMREVAEEMKRVKAATGRPVVLTEVGWPNRDYALTEPWGRNDDSGAVTYEQSLPLWEIFREELAPALEDGGYFAWEAGYGSTGHASGTHNILGTPVADVALGA